MTRINLRLNIQIEHFRSCYLADFKIVKFTQSPIEQIAQKWVGQPCYQ
jgi:hypothetical protein